MKREDKKISIEGLSITIGDTKISVSVDQAKELQRQLNQLFGWNFPYYYPHLTKPYLPWPYDVFCGNTILRGDRPTI